MPNKLMIVMVNTDPSNGAELGAPFFQATVAVAMEYEVEVILTARAGELAIKGVAEKLHVQEGNPKSVYDFIKDAHEAGLKRFHASAKGRGVRVLKQTCHVFVTVGDK